MKKKTLVVLSGPTGIGKTDLSIDLAGFFGCSILSVDSRQCFVELNIGVAKPTIEQLERIPHFFIGTHTIKDHMNAGIFEQYALKTLDALFEEQDIVLAVGGTGLYIKALMEGIDPMPEVPLEIRAQLNDQYKNNGLEWLQKETQLKDPLFWETAERENPQRLLRALEILFATGTSIVEMRKSKKAVRPFNIVSIGLSLPMELLSERISKRVTNMFDAGLLAEVESLKAYRHFNALQTVGYKECLGFFDGEATLDETIRSVAVNTRKYAKRQMTWFRKYGNFKWFENNETAFKAIIQHIIETIGS